jgi:hypothetical protein
VADLSAEWVAEQLRKHADDDLRVAAQSGFVGMNERDVLILDASKGVLAVLEVKDWSEPSLRGTKKSEKIWEVRGLGEMKAPLKQAEEGMLALLRQLPSHCRPRRRDGDARVEYTWLYGLVFTKLSHDEAQGLGLFSDYRLLPPNMPYLWCDNFRDNPVQNLRRAIDNSLRVCEWKPKRTPKKFRDMLWAHISPDENAAPKTEHRRIKTKGDRSELDADFASRLTPQHGPHRVNGVVGSGKTLYIAHKALEKGAEAANRKQGGQPLFASSNRDVLVICKTRSAASKLRNDLALVAKKSYPPTFNWEDFIEVHHQYDFLCRHYNVRGLGDNNSDFVAKQQPCVKYDAIFVDEYQDFEAEWGAFLVRHLHDPRPEGSLILLTFDPAQGSSYVNLAARFDEIIDTLAPGEKAYDWKSRDHYLGKCYRVPSRIGKLATLVHVRLTQQHFEDPTNASAERLAAVIDRAMRPNFISDGGSLMLRPAKVDSCEDEALAICECVQDLCQTTDCSLGDMILAVPPSPFNPDEGQALADCLAVLKVDNLLLLGNQRDRFYQRGERLVIGTPVRLKGLEIPIVILAPSLLRYLEESRTRKDAFYQAATRATSHLAIVGEGPLFDELVELHEGLT